MNLGKIKRLTGSFFSIASLFGTPSISAAQGREEYPNRESSTGHSEHDMAFAVIASEWLVDNRGYRPRSEREIRETANVLRDSYELVTSVYCEQEANRRVEAGMDRDVRGNRRDREKREKEFVRADLDRKMEAFKNDRRVRRVLDSLDDYSRNFAAWGFVVGPIVGADPSTMRRIPNSENSYIANNVAAFTNDLKMRGFDCHPLVDFTRRYVAPSVSEPMPHREVQLPVAPVSSSEAVPSRPEGGYMGVQDVMPGVFSQISVSAEAIAAANHWTTNVLNEAVAQGQIRPEQMNDKKFRHDFLDSAMAQQLPEGYQDAAGVASRFRIPQGASSAPTRQEDRVVVLAFMIVKNDSKTIPYQNLSAQDKTALEGLAAQVENIVAPRNPEVEGL